MKLKDLLAGIEVLASNADLETDIPGVCYDSRKVQPGELFVAVTGYATDGHAYIGKAKAAGAAAQDCDFILISHAIISFLTCGRVTTATRPPQVL